MFRKLADDLTAAVEALIARPTLATLAAQGKAERTLARFIADLDEAELAKVKDEAIRLPYFYMSSLASSVQRERYRRDRHQQGPSGPKELS